MVVFAHFSLGYDSHLLNTRTHAHNVTRSNDRPGPARPGLALLATDLTLKRFADISCCCSRLYPPQAFSKYSTMASLSSVNVKIMFSYLDFWRTLPISL